MSPVTILSSDRPFKLRALSGHAGMHWGSPPHMSQTWALWFVGLSVIAPYLQASMHQSQPLHFCSSTLRAPVSLFWVSASSGHAGMHGASLQALQATAVLNVCSILIERIRDLRGLKTFCFSNEHAYSHMSQPTHLSLSHSTCWLTMFKA